MAISTLTSQWWHHENENKNVFPNADTRNECQQKRRICIWKLSIINVVITTTTTATATATATTTTTTTTFSCWLHC